ncbi:MAG: O-antigen ligase family protein [Phycisphaerae bacterium]|nr:O-antigen ligase family protein [Phycisphaerae bacterium]
MQILGQQKIELLPLLAVLVLGVLAIGVGIIYPPSLPVAIGGVAVFMLMFAWALKWDVTIWAWLWVLSYGFLNAPEWNLKLAGFFNMTPPRFIFIFAAIVFVMYFFLHHKKVKFDRGIMWAMAALLVYLAINIQMHGWVGETQTYRSAPYYRFIGSILLPFSMFFLFYNAGSKETMIRRGLILITIYGWYALYIGYLQYAGNMGIGAAWKMIWPAYIKNPEYGYHIDRARGAFFGPSPQAVFLVTLFFVDLYLIRKLKGNYKYFVIGQAILTPPAVFFTGMRSAYIAILACGLIWVIWGGRRRFALMKIGIVVVLLCVVGVTQWERLTTAKRLEGGVSARGPVVARLTLLKSTWKMYCEKPLMGVGFGHFVSKQLTMEREADSYIGLEPSVLVQHNLFLNMAAETGTIGLGLTILVFILLFRESRKLYSRIPAQAAGDVSREFVVLFWVIFANYLIDAMFRDPLWDPFSNGLLWCFAAIVVCLNRLLDPAPLELPLTAAVAPV